MLRATAGCSLLAFLVWLGAFHVEPLHVLDARVLAGLSRLDGTVVEDVVELFSSVINPLPYLILCAAIVGVGARTAGARAGLAAAVVIAGANVTTRLLKWLAAEPRFSDLLDRQIDSVSWPSGHATAASVALLAALLLAPTRLRAKIALLGGAWAGVVTVGVVVNHWHYPSDALGGVLVAGAWASAAAGRLRTRRPAQAATAARRRRWLRATG